MAQINKSMIIHDIIAVDQEIVPILLGAGMHCVGCPSAQGESLEMAAMIHGIDADELVNQINQYLADKEAATEAEQGYVQKIFSKKTFQRRAGRFSVDRGFRSDIFPYIPGISHSCIQRTGGCGIEYILHRNDGCTADAYGWKIFRKKFSGVRY